MVTGHEIPSWLFLMVIDSEGLSILLISTLGGAAAFSKHLRALMYLYITRSMGAAKTACAYSHTLCATPATACCMICSCMHLQQYKLHDWLLQTACTYSTRWSTSPKADPLCPLPPPQQRTCSSTRRRSCRAVVLTSSAPCTTTSSGLARLAACRCPNCSNC